MNNCTRNPNTCQVPFCDWSNCLLHPPKESAATPPDVEQEGEACGVCGNKKVEIRGRFPKDARRLVCPTCAYERLEQINELSSKNYGQTYTNHQTAKQ